MVKKLAALDLLEHEPYRGARLTDAGERVAVEVIRHHRLLELYLAQTLGLRRRRRPRRGRPPRARDLRGARGADRPGARLPDARPARRPDPGREPRVAVSPARAAPERGQALGRRATTMSFPTAWTISGRSSRRLTCSGERRFVTYASSRMSSSVRPLGVLANHVLGDQLLLLRAHEQEPERRLEEVVHAARHALSLVRRRQTARRTYLSVGSTSPRRATGRRRGRRAGATRRRPRRSARTASSSRRSPPARGAWSWMKFAKLWNDSVHQRLRLRVRVLRPERRAEGDHERAAAARRVRPVADRADARAERPGRGPEADEEEAAAADRPAHEPEAEQQQGSRVRAGTPPEVVALGIEAEHPQGEAQVVPLRSATRSARRRGSAAW